MKNRIKSNTDFYDLEEGYSSIGMCNVAAAVVGSAVVGGIAQSDAARKAGNRQADAAREAAAAQKDTTASTNALQWQMYQQSLATQSPYLQAGQLGTSALLGALGLGGIKASPGSKLGTPAAQGGVDQSGLPAGVGGLTNYGASQDELDAAGGQFAGALTKNFTAADLDSYLAPNYQFQLQQGNQGLKAALAATGQLQTGQGLKDIVQFNQDYAGNAYQNAFNNYQTQQTNLYNRLLGLTNIGQNAANTATGAATTTGSNISANTKAGTAASNNYLTGAAAAQAAGTVGQANAWSGAFNNAVNGWMGSQLYGNLMKNPTGGVGMASPTTKIPETDWSNIFSGARLGGNL